MPVTNGITFYTQKNSLYEPFQFNASRDTVQSMADPMHHIQSPFLPWLVIVSEDAQCLEHEGCFGFFFLAKRSLDLFPLLCFLVKPVGDIT